MATANLIQCMIDKYEALTAANFPSSSRPRIDFVEPPHIVSSAAHDPPYVAIEDIGRTIKPLDFERNNIIDARFRFRVFAREMADVDHIVNAIRFNGGTVGAGSGFDYGTLSTLDTPKFNHQIIPVAEPRRLSDRVDKDGQRMHAAELDYKVLLLERS